MTQTTQQANAAQLEIERKFLIEYPDIPWLEHCPDCVRAEITQTYLLAREGGEARVRMRTEGGRTMFFHTVKRGVTARTRIEQEREITQAEYISLLADADPACRPLMKTRYCLMYGAQRFEIDVYPFWQDRAIVEIELSGEEEEIHFPPQLRVIREVTGEKGYKNASLARLPVL